VLVVVASLAAMTSCTRKDDSAPVTGPAAPVAAEAPVSADVEVRPPSTREAPVGETLFVVDSSSKSVYEFDTARRRFRGPAPEVVLPNRRVTLPGYPVQVSHEFPQDATVAAGYLVVAGGLDGTAVFLDRSRGDLAVYGSVKLPVREVVLEDSGKRATNADSDAKRPFIVLVSAFGRDRVLAVSREDDLVTSVGYVVDPAKKDVVAAAQLPGGLAANVVHSYRDTAIAGMATKKLVFLSEELRSTREIALPGNPTDLVVVGDTAYVSLREPTALVKVDLVSGMTEELAAMPDETIGGPVAVEGRTVWWAHTGLGTVTRLDLVTGKATKTKVCESLSSMVRHNKALYMSCPGKKMLAVIRDGGPVVAYKVDGFPISIAPPL
jgi:hypothetical protein